MRAAGDWSRTACKSLQLCAGIKAGIYGATQAVTQRRQDQTASKPEGRAGEESEYGIIAEADDKGRDGDESEVVGTGEVPAPPGGRQAM